MGKQAPPPRPASARPEVDRIDPGDFEDQRCPHCGAPMSKRGCATCAHELARLGAGSHLVDDQPLESAAARDAQDERAAQGAPRMHAAPSTPPVAIAPAQTTAPKVSYTAAERTRLRQLVAAVGERMPRSTLGGAVDVGLAGAWASLVEAMALGDEPRTRVCPTCGHTGMHAATRCGHCWRPLAALGS